MNPIDMYKLALEVLNLGMEIEVVDIECLTESDKNLGARFFALTYRYGESLDNMKVAGELYFNPDVKEDLTHERVHFRYSDFLRNFGYELNEDNYTILSVLHEIGHIVFENICNKYGVTSLSDKIAKYSENTAFDVLSFEDIKKISEEGPHLPTMLFFKEPWCDFFAVKNFPLLYNALQKVD